MTRILVIEDETVLRENILEWLTFEGYEAVGAADGIDGVNEAIRFQPDLIVCDIMMPRLDGYGVLADLQNNSTTHLTPFIFLTARAMPDDLRTGMALGADDYITKPFERTDLLRAIAARLEKKARQEQEREQQAALFTEMLSYERQQHWLLAKLTAMFSQDFRMPLMAIRSSNAALREFVDDADVRLRLAYIDRIENNANNLIQMLDDLVLVARMDTDQFTIRLEPLFVRLFMRDVLKPFEVAHSITHRFCFESSVSDVLVSDKWLLKQILTQIISNAVLYSPPGTEIRISVSSQQQNCIVAVSDEGIGIPEADQSHIFEPFYRGANTKATEGKGLGLAIVNQAVGLLGGAIEFQTSLNSGTTFTVTIPDQRLTGQVDS
jgi:signal transduction histidine kinase